MRGDTLNMTLDGGYIPNPEAADALADSQSLCYGDQIAAMVAADNGRDVYAYRAVVHLLGRSAYLRGRHLKYDGERWRLRARNQGRVGSCVGMGTANALDVMQAYNITEEGQAESLPYRHSADAMYGISRHAIGMFSGKDGSYGAAAIRGGMEIGLLYERAYDGVDLESYSESRARQWASSGVPPAMRDEAGRHKLVAYQRVTSGEQAWALAGAGRPIIMCSQVGWDGERDADGAIRRSGRWAHCMAAGAARRTTRSGRRLLLVLQSYGSDYVKGPYYADQPLGSFYADVEDIDAAVRQGDSWAVSDAAGFAARGGDPWA